MTRKKAIKKVDAREAKFGEWFVAQFGSSPDSRSELEIINAISVAERAVLYNKYKLKQVQEYKVAADAALKAWNAARTQR